MLGGADARTAFDADGLLDRLKKALSESTLNAEMEQHAVTGEPGNTLSGYGRNTVTTGTGKIELEIPRDRAGSFDPALIAKYRHRFRLK
jgi:putative transposase